MKATPRQLILILTCLVCVALFGTMCRLGAQGTTATILGTVTDVSGAAVPEATVQAKNTGTGNVQNTSSDDQGRFQLADLQVGEYEVAVTKQGFSNVVHRNVVLAVGSRTVVDFSMQVGQQEQTITVESQASQVETTTATISSTTSEIQMKELP